MNLKKELYKGIPIAFLVFFGFHNTAFAQPCLVNQLTINTGYNPITNTTLAVGAADTNWMLTGGDASFFSASGAVLGPSEVTAQGWPANNPNSRWISYDATGYTGYPGPSGNLYKMELSRKFRMCDADNITFNFNIARDNYVEDILVDNVPAGIFSEAPNYDIPNFTGFTPATATLALTAGVHTIKVLIWNHGYASVQNNPHGLNIYGTLTGTNNSLVGPTCSPDLVCLLSTKEITQEPKFSIYPNPAYGDIYINSSDAVSIQLLDKVGRLVYNDATLGKQHHLALSHLAKGIYMVKLTGAESIVYKKIVLE